MNHAFNFALEAKQESSLPSPFDLFDLSMTAKNIAINFKIPYNEAQGVKNRFRPGEMECAKILAYLSLLELDELRTSNPNAYAMFLREKSLNFWVWTNRAQIRTMMDHSFTSLSTVNRYVRILTDSGVLTRKDNSRRALGPDSKRVLDARGRGNFRLWINRQVLVEKRSTSVENAPNEAEIIQFEAKTQKTQKTDNQQIAKGNSKTLSQSPTLTPKNKKISINNGLKGATHQISDILSNVAYKQKTKEDKTAGFESQIAKAKIEETPSQELQRAGAEHINRVSLDQTVASRVPSKELDKAAYLLLYAIFANIYPKYNQIAINSVQMEANWMLKQILKKIMDSFDVPLEVAFEIALRGLSITQNIKEKNPNFKFYHILTWLNTTYDKGTFWYVIDKFVREERKRIAMTSKDRQERIRWQSARQKIDAMVADTLYTLSKGLSNTAQVMEFNKKRLKMTLGKLKVSDQQKDKFLKEYSDRLMASMHKFKTKAAYDAQDKFQKNFSNYLIQIASKAKKA